jgi:hypothetical protein
MSPLHRRDALTARIHTLERHAVALQQAFRSEAMKADAGSVITRLNQAKASLSGADADDIVPQVEAVVEAASRDLAGLGRASALARPTRHRR